MEWLTSLLLLLGAGVLVFLSYTAIRRHPESFRPENINRSFFTLGILALILIGFVALLVLYLRH